MQIDNKDIALLMCVLTAVVLLALTLVGAKIGEISNTVNECNKTPTTPIIWEFML